MSDSIKKYSNNLSGNGNGTTFLNPSMMYQQEQQENGGLDPKKVIYTIYRYKWLVLLFLIAGGTGAWFYADTLPPTYKSEGTLFVNTSDASVNNELSQIILQTTGIGTNSTLESELQVMKSRNFSLEVARKVMKDKPGDLAAFPMLWRVDDNGRVSRAEEGTVGNRIRSGLDFVRTEDESNVIEVSFSSSSPREAAYVVNEVMEHYVESSTRQNRQAAASTADFLEKEKRELKQKLEGAEQQLRRYMDATGIVQVDEQATGVISQRASTETELQDVTLELETISEAIANYEAQLEKIKPGLSDQFTNAIGPRIQNAQDQLAQYERERTLIIAKNPGVLDRRPVPSRLKFVTEQIEQLKREIKSLSNQLFTDGEQFVGLSSEARAQRVADIQNNLVELKISQNQNRSRRDALLEQKRDMDASFSSLPQGMIELAKLQRNVRINEELYLNVSRQYADMSVWKQSQFGFGRIIDSAAVPGVPISPNKKMLLILGVMLGGFLSAAFITIREFMDDSVKSMDQLRTMYLPSITFSVIPSIDRVSEKNRKSFDNIEGKIPNELVLLQDRTSMVSESVRRLKNSIIYQHGDVPPKTVSVTSPEKGDGKSTLVANLGIAFADDGYKTLVIDTDFRRPRLGDYFGVGNELGLSDFLLTKTPLQKVIQRTELENLKLITAGDTYQKLVNIGNNQAFDRLIRKMEEIFDVIILDTPPYGIISDSAVLLKKSEVTLMVARYRNTNKEMLFRTMEELGRIGANVTNIVVNDFDYRKETSHYYTSGYYKTMYTNYESYVQ